MRTSAPLWALTLLLSPCVAAHADVYPMQAGNPQRWNQALTASTLAFPVKELWDTVKVGACPWGGPLVLPDQIVISRDSLLESVDRKTGAVQWVLQDFVFPDTPSYDADRGVIYGNDFNGNTYGLSTTGQVLWTHSDAGTLQAIGSPLYLNNEIYALTGGNGLICLDPDTQAVVWRAAATEGYTLKTPAYDNGRLYVPTVEGTVFCLDASDGSVVWSVDTGLAQNTTILVQGSYFYRNCSLGLVECRNVSDGSLVWSYQCGSFTSSDLAFSGGLLIVTNDDRHVRALDPGTGQLIWDKAFDGNFARCAPLVVCDNVFVSGCTGQFYGLDATNGDTEWTYNYTGANAFTDWAVADGCIYTADAVGHTFAFTSVAPGEAADCVGPQGGTLTPTFTDSPTPTQTSTRTPTDTRTATRTDTPTKTPTYTRTGTPTFTSTATPSDTATPTPTVTSTFTATPSSSSTPTALPTLTASPAWTRTGTFTETPAFSATETGTPSASPTPTSVATGSAGDPAGPDATPTCTAFLTPAGACGAAISKVMIAPNPACGAVRQSVCVLLGSCGADSVQFQVYSKALVLVGRWGQDTSAKPGNSWCQSEFPGSLRLPPGLYYLGAGAQVGGQQCRRTATFMVLR